MTLAGLLTWWNLLYLVPFGVAAIYLFIYTLTGITFGDADLDADADAHLDVDTDAHLDVDTDAHLEIDADADGDAEHDVEHDAESEHDGEGGGGNSLTAILSLLGVGRAPLSLLLMIFLILWGVIGLAINQLVLPMIGSGVLTAAISLPVTLLVASTLTGVLARLIARFMPMTETYSRSKASLVGRRGQAVSAIDEKFGLAAVREASGDLYQVPSRVGIGKPPIQKGATIVLFDYDAEADVFLVAPIVEDREKLRATTIPRRPAGDPNDRIAETPLIEQHAEPPERLKN